MAKNQLELPFMATDLPLKVVESDKMNDFYADKNSRPLFVERSTFIANDHSPLISFYAKNGRWPRLGDPIQPWEYSGWMLNGVMEFLASHPELPDRYGYLCDILKNHSLPDAPIPQIRFNANSEATNFRKTIEQNWIAPFNDTVFFSNGFSTLVHWLGWALGTRTEKPSLNPNLSEKLYRIIDVTPMLLYPYDYFGDILSENSGWNPYAFFPTPHNVVEMIVQMQFADPRDARLLNVCDPCLGTGRMLLHASNYSLRLYGMDIDPLVLEIAKINAALYAPWMIHSVDQALGLVGPNWSGDPFSQGTRLLRKDALI